MNNTNYQDRIKAVLQEADRYDQSLCFLVESMATCLQVINLCRSEIESLTTTTIEREDGTLQVHPVFRTLRDAQANLTKHAKALGLDFAAVSKVMEEDPFKDFMEQMQSGGDGD